MGIRQHFFVGHRDAHDCPAMNGMGGCLLGVLPYELTLTSEESVKVAHISGDIDLAAAIELGPQLLNIARSGPAELLIDLSEVTLIDSEGVKMLLSVVDTARGTGRLARVTQLSESAERVIRIIGLGEMLGCPDTAQSPTPRRSPFRPRDPQPTPPGSFQ
jgi:anti-anti-sigma factor